MEHFYYKEWPDRSCPSECQSIIELISKLPIGFDDEMGLSTPILVHCSAGIGRTGTFIGICNLIEMMRQTEYVNPKLTVTEMRKQRAFLVQNWVK